MLALPISLYDARLRFLERRLRCAPEAEAEGSNPSGGATRYRLQSGISPAARHEGPRLRGSCERFATRSERGRGAERRVPRRQKSRVRFNPRARDVPAFPLIARQGPCEAGALLQRGG